MMASVAFILAESLHIVPALDHSSPFLIRDRHQAQDYRAEQNLTGCPLSSTLQTL
jgi:hypothetical protein